MSRKKKVIILSVMVALLLVIGYVNVMLNNSLSNKTTTKASSTVTETFYTTYRSERDSTRRQELQFYESIIASATASASAKEEAEANKMALIAQMEKELVTEGIIIGKGFNDVIVTQSDANVNVFVKSNELSKSEVAMICEVVKEQLGVGLDKIVIIPSE